MAYDYIFPSLASLPQLIYILRERQHVDVAYMFPCFHCSYTCVDAD